MCEEQQVGSRWRLVCESSRDCVAKRDVTEGLGGG
jgi:hypothetical protein